MPHKVETCIGNDHFGTAQLLLRAAVQFPDTQTRLVGCLGNCHRCYRAAFVLVDDFTIVEAASSTELWERLRAMLA